MKMLSSRQRTGRAGSTRQADNSSGRSLGARVRRLLGFIAIGAVLLYVVGAAGGYAWMRYSRKNEQITFTQVLFLRWPAIKRGLAAQQFAQAKTQWEANSYQDAYLRFTSALRNDPDNIEGRLMAARFFNSVGGGSMALSVLEDGVLRAPQHEDLIRETFDLLTTRGLDQRALTLISRLPSSSFKGSGGTLLRMYQVLATLNTQGVGAANEVLDRYPGLRGERLAAPVVARVMWESRERLGAIELMKNFIQAMPGKSSDSLQLAQWQAAGGMVSSALETAREASTRFPSELAPRLLVIQLVGQQAAGSADWRAEIERFLRDFASRPESVPALAELAGRMGWVNLAQACYEVGATRSADLHTLALYWADALGTVKRFSEALQILAQIEGQSAGAAPAFLVALQQRQVMIASAKGDRDTTREAARRLGSALANDQETLQRIRTHFAKLGLADAVAEISGPAPSSRKN